MKKTFTYLAVALSSILMHAQSGNLDSSFGQNGFVVDSFSPDYDSAEKIVLQADGKILVMGDTGFASIRKMAVARYNADGSIDTSFGNEGKLNITTTMPKSFARDGIVQPDGKIILSGYQWDNSTGDLILVRLNTDGSFDTSFGNQGIAVLDNNGMNEVGSSIHLQADGKIIIAGDADDQFTMGRVNADGTIDTTFGTNGWVRTSFPIWSSVNDIHVNSTGEILVTGMAMNPYSNWKVGLAKYDADGNIDFNFGENGTMMLSIGIAHDFAIRGILLDDGKMYIGSHSYYDTRPLRYEVVVSKFNANGSLDTTYGTGGNTKVRWVENGENNITDMLLQDDGKILVSGRGYENTSEVFAIAKFDADGKLDNTFGTQGKVTANVGETRDMATSIALQTDGKLVVSGYTSNMVDPTNFFIARYTNDILAVTDFSKTEFSIYPNPASEELNVNWSLLSNTDTTYEIYDSNGRMVKRAKMTNKKAINVADLASGVYILKLKNNNSTVSQKFIKK
ncbi:T9SS type A sorting domain-containing protein [Vaginella massiliensis]|uniref:T9SS type A sorting domain-containing protein n=1 Tax=Vaginella massiliensis TaxID=1816680 RepID=UPI0037528E2C